MAIGAMQPELALPASRSPLAAIPAHWRVPALRLAAVWAALILLFLPEWAAMAHQWWDVSTYNHILLVPVILAWLVAIRARGLSVLQPQPWWPGLGLLAAALFVWLLGNVASINFASQLGAALMMQAAVPLLLGPRVMAALLFPLAYAIFLVPLGDALVPPLQMVTARLTVALTHWSGVPVTVDGVFIDTPAGLFEVAEECSGVKFLIAMIALGTLVAHLCIRHWPRRALFMATAIILPVLANGVRAWGTIFIAQSHGVEFAAGFDHIFYGWIFFAVVMALLLGAWWPFFDRPVDDDFVRADRLERSRLLGRCESMAISARAAVAGAALLVAAVLGWSMAAHASEARLPPEIALPDVQGWERVDYAPAIWWAPKAEGASHRLVGSYRNGSGQRVEVFYALYAGQDEGREAGGFGQGALMPDSAWRWLSPAQGVQGGHGEWLQADGSVRRLVMTWYRTGNVLTGSNSRLKLANIANRLAMQERPTAMLILSVESEDAVAAEAALARFTRDAGPLPEWMDRIARLD